MNITNLIMNMTQKRVQLACEVKGSVIVGKMKIIRKKKIIEKETLQGYVHRRVDSGGREV